MKFFSKYLPAFIISVSIFILVYVLYRSQIQSNSERFSYYLNYIIIISIFIFFLFLTFFLKRKIRAEINIIILASFFSLYLVEGIINILVSFAEPAIYNKKLLDKKFDTRSRIEVLIDERKKYPNAVVTALPLSFASDVNSKILPLAGISNRKTVFCNELGYWVTYQSDRFGFRNPDQEWAKDKIEYLLVGDSLTHGMCVNEKDTISGNLRHTLNNKRYAVLNLGMWGDGPLLMFAKIREYLEKNKTSKVLWIYCEGNDLQDFYYEKKNKILMKYLQNKSFSQNLKTKQDLINISLKRHLLDEEKKKMNYLNDDYSFNIINYIKLSEIRKLTINI